MTLLRNTCALPWNPGTELNFREKEKKKKSQQGTITETAAKIILTKTHF